MENASGRLQNRATIIAARCVELSIINRKIEMHPDI
jgi:hypothetical protein